MIGAVSTEVSRPPHMADDATRPSSDPESLTSFELVVMANAGDDRARTVLLERYSARLNRWAHGRLPQSARGAYETHDLVQDTLIRVWNSLPTFTPRHEGAFQGYVRTILWNRIRDLGRQHNGHPSDPIDDQFPGRATSPVDEAIGAETLARYEAALGRLRPEDRELIIARVEMGLSYKELVPMFNKPSVPAVTMAVSRALVRLAEEMAHERRSR
jgi:RNA polymerase sigma factor (sigma-70 family)